MAARKTRSDGVGVRILRAISHPIRIEALRVLSNRVVSPKELAKETGESVSNVSYHFNYLRQEECIEVVYTEPRRGAVEHYYRARADTAGAGMRDFLGEAVRALDADTLGDRQLTWTPIELDEEGWRELGERQREWLEEIERIKDAAGERLARGNVSSKRVIAGTIGFETPPGPGFASASAEA